MIPGVGPVIAGGVLAAALGGAAVGAAAGGLLGALVGMGVPEDEAKYYNQEFEAGRTIVTARADGRYDEAYNIIRQCGGYDARSGSQQNYAGSQYAAADMSNQPTQGRNEQTMPLREEQLRTRKEQVQAGEVGIHKEVVTETRTVDVPVTREEVVVERRPVKGNPPAQSDINEGEDIRIPVSEERVRVEKEPVVTEEVRVRKQPVQETEHISEEVRRERARVDRQGNVRVEGDGQGTDTTE